MRAMKRREECAGDAERGKMQILETVEVHVDEVERGGWGVGYGLDSGCVDVVVDDRATRIYTNNCHGHDNAKIVLGVALESGPAITITR